MSNKNHGSNVFAKVLVVIALAVVGGALNIIGLNFELIQHQGLEALIEYKTIISSLGVLVSVGTLIYAVFWMVVSYRKCGRGNRRLEEEAKAVTHDVAKALVDSATFAPLQRLDGIAGALDSSVNALSHMAEVTSLLGNTLSAVMVCWAKVIAFMGEGCFYQAALAIAGDERVASLTSHQNLIRAIYQVALADKREMSGGEVYLIKNRFPFVLGELPPMPMPSESSEKRA